MIKKLEIKRQERNEYANDLLTSTKGELIDLYKKYIDTKAQIDTAIPITWSKEVKEYGIDTSQFMIIYDETDRFGRPISRLEIIDKLYRFFNNQLLEEV